MSLFESKDYEKLYDGFNSQERDLNLSPPPLPLCSGRETTVHVYESVSSGFKNLEISIRVTFKSALVSLFISDLDMRVKKTQLIQMLL